MDYSCPVMSVCIEIPFKCINCKKSSKLAIHNNIISYYVHIKSEHKINKCTKIRAKFGEVKDMTLM